MIYNDPKLARAIINIAKPVIFLLVRWFVAKEFGREADVSEPSDTQEKQPLKSVK